MCVRVLAVSQENIRPDRGYPRGPDEPGRAGCARWNVKVVV